MLHEIPADESATAAEIMRLCIHGCLHRFLPWVKQLSKTQWIEL